MIDFHCHLDLIRDPFRAVKRFIDKEIYMLSVTTIPSAWKISCRLEYGSKFVKTALGLHPQVAHERHNELELFDSLLSKTRYVGEIGLDCTPEFIFSIDIQKKVFGHILKSCSNAGGKILSIHSLRSSKLVLEMISENSDCGVPVLHWFSGSNSELRRAVSMGCWFSVGPPMTRSNRGKEIVRQIPGDRILTETDAPFANVNGRPCTPLDIYHAVIGLAEIWGIKVDEADKRIMNNFRTLVSKF